MRESMSAFDAAGAPREKAERRRATRNYARTLGQAGYFAEADGLLQELQRQALQLDGDASVEYAMVTWQRAVLARRMKDVAHGPALVEQARGLWSKLVPEAHPIFAHVLRTSAAFEQMSGDLASAERDQRLALQRVENNASPVDTAIARAVAETLAKRLAIGDATGA